MNAEKGLKNNDLLIGTLLSVLLLLFGHLGLIEPVFSFTSGLFNNIQSANYEIFSNFENDISFVADLAGIKVQLEKYKNESEFYIVESERLRLELDSLDKLLEQDSFDLPYDLIPVRVLLYTNEQSAIVINKGDADNIKVGDSVILHNNYIGRVTKTYQSKSLVELISSANSKIPVVVPVDSLKGFLTGQGGNQLLLEDVPNTKILSKGAIVLTSGSDLKIPYGLIIGKISEIISVQTDVLQEANVEPLISINQLSEVYIIKSDE